jgi:hypothetical protein
MTAYLKVAILENEIEAMLLESVLKERKVPHLIQSYYDTAYDGLFQAQKGWGAVKTPEKWKNYVIQILEDIRSKGPDSAIE